MSEKLVNAIVELKEEKAISLARELADSGTDPSELLNMGIEAMGQIGERFEKGDYFLPELLIAGELMDEINKIVLPLMADQSGTETGEQVVLGTVSGDVHDIGKNIVKFMLEANGYKVLDLGIDVPPQAFVDKVQESGSKYLGLSALLTVSYDSMKETIEALKASGLREGVKVMIGGAPVDDLVLKYSGADALGASAVAAVDLVNNWIDGKAE